MLVLPSVNSMNYDTREDVPTDAILAQLLGRQLTVLIDLKPTPQDGSQTLYCKSSGKPITGRPYIIITRRELTLLFSLV